MNQTAILNYGMGWDGMGWVGMGWNGMGWDGMGWGDVRFFGALL